MVTTDHPSPGAAAAAILKPKLRGVSHQVAFFVSLIFGAVLLLFLARNLRDGIALGIYALSLSALLGTSATYHRINWRKARTRQLMRRLDHSMIFFLIAGTYTPFALLALHGTLAKIILIVVWGGAIAAAVVELIWIDHPKWVAALTYLALGWVSVVIFPELWSSIGPMATLLLGSGGMLYTLGAVVYATQKPDPAPEIFGYHEVFHALVIIAAALQASVITFAVAIA